MSIWGNKYNYHPIVILVGGERGIVIYTDFDLAPNSTDADVELMR